MLKLYLPTGNHQEKIINLLKETGLRIHLTHHGNLVKVESNDLPIKIIPTQDMPQLLTMNKADVAITTSDVLREFLLLNPHLSSKIAIILELQICKTKLAAISSKDTFPLITNFAEFLRYARKQGKTKIIVATEYQAITKNWLKKKGVSSVEVLIPYSMARSWILPPNPEADLAIEVVKNDEEISESNCQIIDIIQENQAVMIASRQSLEDQTKRQRIENLLLDVRRGLYKIMEREARLKQAQLPLPELKTKPVPIY